MQANTHDQAESTNPFDDEFEIPPLPPIAHLDPIDPLPPPPPPSSPVGLEGVQLSSDLLKIDPEKAARHDKMIKEYVSQLITTASQNAVSVMEPIEEGVDDGEVFGVGPPMLPDTPTSEIDSFKSTSKSQIDPEPSAVASSEVVTTQTTQTDETVPASEPNLVVDDTPISVDFPDIDFNDEIEAAIRASLQTQVGPSIPNVINSCYLDSLLVAMFMIDAMDPVLSQDSGSEIGNNLLIIIKTQIIDPLRRGEVVPEDTMRLFRQQLIAIGWQTDDDEYDQQDIKELYDFLCEKLNLPLTKVRRVTFSSASPSERDFGKEEKMSYIPLNLAEEEFGLEEIKTGTLLHNWLNHNTTKAERKLDGKDATVDVLNTYQFVDTDFPPLISLAINRFPSATVRYEGKIQPNVLLLPFKHEKGDICKMTWDIQGLVCHRPAPLPDPVPEGYSPLKSGHYYCYYLDGDKMMRFNDLDSPSLVEVDRYNRDEKEDMERHLVFVIYRRRIM